jgi:hypothetical protein
MLGVTVCAIKAEPGLATDVVGWGVGVGSTVLLHDAGAFGPSARAGQASLPLGSDETPGVGCVALSPELQLALGPEAGHCRLPTGSERRIGSLLGITSWT